VIGDNPREPKAHTRARRGRARPLARFRAAPLAAAVCAVLAQHAPTALAGPDACTGSSVRTCQGNQSAGISFSSGVTDLNVLNLSTNISPGPGVTGVRLSSSGSNGDNGGSYPIVGAGGDGGDNGSGLTIRVTADGRFILTNNLVIPPLFNFSAYGILGQSLGGDGGDGGNGTAVLVTPGLGGDGGAGGNGGSVTITSDIGIVTTGTSAHGIYGLSRGGNGGDGGDGNGVGIVYAEGGDAGKGGRGETVTINSTGAITTYAASAQGIYARSLGGVSGDGGAGTLSTVGKGGAAAGSGPGGDVTVTNSGTITTHGSDARGISAQSVGGFAAQAGTGAGLVGFGGSGESSGNGGNVRVNNYDVISTGGARADAIFAESVGGGGGSAGGSGGLFALGGSGSAGGSGRTVNVTNTETLTTSGTKSRGIFAQSVGGGGGDGGASGGLVTFGGSGSSTGSGDTVTVTNGGAITTGGTGAQAIFAQSLGGGGGDGGVGVGLITFGGSGGAGGKASQVTVTNTGTLATIGADAAVLLAQSLGGGGGNGGGAVSVSAFAGFALGGSGGPGSDGGAVQIDTRTGTIETAGARSHGVQAESIGGGGGNGGFSVALSGGVGGSVSVAIGGRAGGGGAGGEVEVDGASAITTRGEDAHAIFAQSVGGGGGNGGFSIAGAGSDGVGIAIAFGGKGGTGGVGDTVNVTSNGTLDTYGDRSYGLLAQSLGGGGGNGGFKITGSGGGLGGGSLNLGGNGSGGGNADHVTVASTGAIATRGEEAYGLLAQSVGGGGGNGSFAIAAAGGGTGAGALGVGGFAGGGGDGRRVDVTSRGTIDTYGLRATALFAQSVGGGGGNGGFSITGAGAGTGAGTFNLGGRGGMGGDGNVVYVDRTGDITTRGNEAHGLLAQSVGGGGGNGGFSIAGSGAGTGAGTIAIGGFGNGGGDGGAVTVTSGDKTETFGTNAIGVFAQSVGGGGGNGAFSIAGAGAGTGSGTFNLGGGGLKGGDGSTVNVTSTGAIDTHGEESFGLLAQSLGGGGGNGGFSIAASGAGTGTGTLNIGGFGGGGGEGGVVTATSSGAVTTTGVGATGLFAQSLGGGGGNGRFSIAGAGAGTGSGAVSIGGFGGHGGNGATVTLTNDGRVTTSGEESVGVLAQSLGGNGGNGGFSLSGSVTPGSKSNFGVNVGGALGGFGGTGGHGGTVTLNNGGSVDTDGLTSHGVVAQSLGGGGGNGGSSVALGLGFAGKNETWDANVNVSVGGSGGNGDFAGTVSATNTGGIITLADDSNGIFAQSVGGGGGEGGSSFTATITAGAANTGKAYNGAISVGGKGGSGNDGGTVTVENGGTVETFGDKSHGVLAQSIGGGGGTGGTARGINLLLKAGSAKLEKDQSAGANWKLSVDVGGNGGAANDGGDVTVDNAGGITTHGDLSHGILAQSIGGGGGSGGDGIKGLGTGTVVDGLFALATFPPESMGGSGNFVVKKLLGQLRDISIVVGGSAGASGDAGQVVVTNHGDLVTMGYGSVGILAQSVGGGGGIAQSFAKSEDAGGTADGGLTGKLAIGGAGGAAGDGGTVRVEHTGRIDTYGDDAHGVFAQSVGGGGGVAGNVERFLSGETCPPQWLMPSGACLPPVNVGLGVGWGQPGGSGGNGGSVTTSTSGDITTRGAGAHGIKAQSVGGGGGAGGGLGRIESAITGLLFDGTVGGAGSGGAITVTHSGNITTLGNEAYGIFAQSAGGANAGGSVTVNVSGNVSVQGEGAHGIFAQSIGGQGGGDVSIDVEGGTVRGGSGVVRTLASNELPTSPADPPVLGDAIDIPVAGVRIEGGANNTLTNRGTVTTLAGVTGMAASGTTGNETVDNYGTMTGSVDFETGANAFNNKEGATLNSGSRAALGMGNALTNAGTLSPGGPGNAATTTLAGNLRQTGTGVFAVDLDHAAQVPDRVDASGSADLAGKARVQNMNTGSVRSGVHTYTILTGAGGVSDSGLALDTHQAAVISYGLVYPNATDVVLQTTVDFAPAQGLNANQRAIGANINAIQNSGGTASFAPVTAALFALPDAQALAAAYDQLSAEGYLPTGTSTVYANEGFSNAMLSCHVRDGDYRFVREGDCGWMRLSAGSVNQDRTSGNFGFNEDAIHLAGGFQRHIGGNWHAGLGVAYQEGDIDVDGLSRTTGNQVQIGAVLKGRIGPTTYSAAVTIGKGWYDTDRYVNIPTPGVVAVSNQNVGLAGARFRLAREWPLGKDGYMRPMIDAAVTYARFDGFNETGAGGADLLVAGRNETWVSVVPAVEVGGEVELADRTLVRPTLKLGITQFVSGTDPSITASFAGTPAGVAPFTVNGEFDRTYFDIDAGVDVLSVNGAVLRVGYLGRFSSNVSANGATLKFSLPF
jgi:hypothetical protein